MPAEKARTYWISRFLYDRTCVPEHSGRQAQGPTPECFSRNRIAEGGIGNG